MIRQFLWLLAFNEHWIPNRLNIFKFSIVLFEIAKWRFIRLQYFRSFFKKSVHHFLLAIARQAHALPYIIILKYCAFSLLMLDVNKHVRIFFIFGNQTPQSIILLNVQFIYLIIRIKRQWHGTSSLGKLLGMCHHHFHILPFCILNVNFNLVFIHFIILWHWMLVFRLFW